jgi:hypothetical protein
MAPRLLTINHLKTDSLRLFESTEEQGGLNNRLIIPLSPPLGKGDLKSLFPTFNWLRECICSLRQVLQQILFTSMKHYAPADLAGELFAFYGK